MEPYVAEPGRPAVERVLILRLSAAQDQALLELLERRGCTLSAYVALRLHTDVAEFRAAHLDTLMGYAAAASIRPGGQNNHRDTKLDPQQMQQLLFLHESQHLGVADLSERFKVSKEQVRNILQECDAAQHVARPGRGGHRGSRWTHGGMTRIEGDKKCDVDT